jgi:predicted small metal-binding protein
MREFDCGCGYHLEGKDDQCLTVKILLHLEAAHPEIEEPTIELAEEMLAIKAYDKSIPSARSPRLFS